MDYISYSYSQVVGLLENFASSHLQIQRFAHDFPEQLQNYATTGATFPFMFASPVDSSYAINTTRHRFRVYLLDQIEKDRTNVKSILNSINLTLEDLKHYLGEENDSTPVILLGEPTAIPLNNFALDYLGGYYIDLDIEIDSHSVCEIPFLNPPIISGFTCDIYYTNDYLTCSDLIDCPVIQALSAATTGNTGTEISAFTFNNINTFTIDESSGNSWSASINQLNLSGPITATTYYGDGSNLSGISTANYYTTGATLIGSTAYFNRNDSLSAYTLDLSTLSSTGNYLPLTGGTMTNEAQIYWGQVSPFIFNYIYGAASTVFSETYIQTSWSGTSQLGTSYLDLYADSSASYASLGSSYNLQSIDLTLDSLNQELTLTSPTIILDGPSLILPPNTTSLSMTSGNKQTIFNFDNGSTLDITVANLTDNTNIQLTPNTLVLNTNSLQINSPSTNNTFTKLLVRDPSNGTIYLKDASSIGIGQYLPLSGGVLTGPITGTSALFTGITESGFFKITTFNPTNPQIYADNDTDTGIMFDGPDILSLHTGGSQRLLINATGQISNGGIATTGKEIDFTGDTLLQYMSAYTHTVIPNAHLTAHTATTINWANSDHFTYILSGNTTFTFSNGINGRSVTVGVTQSISTSGYTAAFSGDTIKWQNGVTPIMSPYTGSTDVYTFVKLNNVVYGSYIQNF